MSGGTIEIADLVIRYDAVPAVNGVSFTVAQGEHVTLLGPSGCGKTTTLRAIAGLEQPVGGSIRIDGETVFSAAQRRNVPTERRGVSMVFQSYAVWPHMSVADNVAYGLRVRKLPKAQIAEAVERALDLVQMRALADRSAALLSGGQQQRVALARAIAFSPTVLLFDEPLSNLDAKLRAEMRVELRALQRRLGVTSLYVTHDQEEALAISDRVIVMNVGGIEQIGGPEDIYNRPKTKFVADFVGSANLIAGTYHRHRGNSGSGEFRSCSRADASGLGRARAAWRRKPCRDPYRIHQHEFRDAGRNGQLCFGNDSPASFSRRLYPIHRSLAGRRADRTPSADRAVRRRRCGDPVVCSRTLYFARGMMPTVATIWSFAGRAGWVVFRAGRPDINRRAGCRPVNPGQGRGE